MTDEQLLAFMTGQGDMSVAERKLANQQALSQSLRQQALSPSTGRDIGSQVARGLTGLGAAYANKYADPAAMTEYTGAKDKMLGGMRDLLLRKPAPQPNVVTPPVSNVDATGFDY